METILRDLTQEQTRLERKPIQFKKSITTRGIYEDASIKPNEFANIDLLVKDYFEANQDLMFAYNCKEYGVLYLGYWNDGFVEQA